MKADRTSGFLYRYLPAYSPDLSPIEPPWAKLKAELRRVAARTAEALQQAIGPALDTIKPGRDRLLPPRRLRLSQLMCGLGLEKYVSGLARGNS